MNNFDNFLHSAVSFNENNPLREGAKKRFLLGTQFLVVAASRSYYLLRTVTSLGCHKHPERYKEQKLGVSKEVRSMKIAKNEVNSTETGKM